MKKVFLKSLVYKLQSLVENKFKYGKTEEFETQKDLLTVQHYRLFLSYSVKIQFYIY